MAGNSEKITNSIHIVLSQLNKKKKGMLLAELSMKACDAQELRH